LGAKRKLRRSATARALISAVAVIVVMGGCGREGATPICATEAGARACLVPRSTGKAYGIEVTGFKPGSQLELTQAGGSAGGGEPSPLRLPLGPDGSYSNGHGGGAGLVVPPGAAPVDVTVSGTAGSGASVVLSLMTRK